MAVNMETACLKLKFGVVWYLYTSVGVVHPDASVFRIAAHSALIRR